MPATKKQIPQWCLEVLLDTPSQQEIADVRRYIAEQRDVARIPDVHRLAAFCLIVRYPATGGRHFSNEEIRLIAKRNKQVIDGVLATVPAITAEVIASLTDTQKKTTKPPTKKAK